MDDELTETSLAEQQAENFSTYLTELNSLLNHALAGKVEVSRDGAEVIFEITCMRDPALQPFSNARYWRMHINSAEGLYKFVLKNALKGSVSELNNWDDALELKRRVKVSF